MPTTSNFGWTTPADTDLVKDGALAIRTLGNGIDTSLVDLKGGTTGQVLSKATNTDLDYTWITPNVGDITEVQAGVGISVASGTGPIPVITNSSTDLITTAGDLLYGTAADTVARLGIGTAGQVLKVNSGATAPEWGAAGSSFSGVLTLKTADQTISNATSTILSFNTETNGYDTDSYHSTVTNNSRITIPTGKNGYFWVWCIITWAPNATGRRVVRILKNGAIQSIMEATPNATANLEPTVVGGKAFSAVATDYFEIEVYQNSGGNLDVYGGSVYNTQFGAYYLGA